MNDEKPQKTAKKKKKVLVFVPFIEQALCKFSRTTYIEIK